MAASVRPPNESDGFSKGTLQHPKVLVLAYKYFLKKVHCPNLPFLGGFSVAIHEVGRGESDFKQGAIL